MILRHRVALLLSLLTAGQSGPLTAQASDLVSRELVVGLLGQWRGYLDYGALLVGRAPPMLSPDLLPADATVLGGLAYDEFSVTVLTLPSNPRQAEQRLDEQIKSNGWTPPPAFPIQEKGFVTGPRMELRKGACKDGAFLRIAASARPAGGSLVTVVWQAPAPGGPCQPPQQVRSYRDQDLPIPALLAPPGTVGETGSSSSGSDYRELRTRLRGRATAQEVLRHYVEQLAAFGWTAASPASGGDVAIQSLRMAGDSGRTWYGTLSVSAPAQIPTIDVALLVRWMPQR